MISTVKIATCTKTSSQLVAPNDGLQLRRAISIPTEGKKLLEKDASRRQLQGFVGLRPTAHPHNTRQT